MIAKIAAAWRRLALLQRQRNVNDAIRRHARVVGNYDAERVLLDSERRDAQQALEQLYVQREDVRRQLRG